MRVSERPRPGGCGVLAAKVQKTGQPGRICSTGTQAGGRFEARSRVERPQGFLNLPVLCVMKHDYKKP